MRTALCLVVALMYFTVEAEDGEGKTPSTQPPSATGLPSNGSGQKTPATVTSPHQPPRKTAIKDTPDEESSDESVDKLYNYKSSSWDFNTFISQISDKLNAQIAALTKSAEEVGKFGIEMRDQAAKVTETSKDMIYNRKLVGRVYSALATVPDRQRTPELMVNAFSTAITVELHEWMPSQVDLPGLEMKLKLKYMCGTGGYITNLKTMKFMGATFNDVKPEDETIDAILSFSFQYLHMTYNHFGESTFLTAPVRGSLDLGFYSNMVEFGLDIPNVSILISSNIKPECLISVKNFTVSHLAVPQATIEPASAYRTYAEEMVDKFAKIHEEEFRNLFRMGVVKSIHKLLKSENKWICKTEELEKLAKIDEENIMKPVRTKRFEKYCGQETPKKDNTEEEGNIEKDNQAQGEKERTKVNGGQTSKSKHDEFDDSSATDQEKV